VQNRKLVTRQRSALVQRIHILCHDKVDQSRSYERSDCAVRYCG
jgi:hypothetical protein